MILGFAIPVAIIVLGFFVRRRGRDERVGRAQPARRLRIAALIPLALQAGVFLLFGVGEMLGGDWSGAGHLVQLAVAVLLAIPAWMRPLEGGLAVLAAGVLQAASMAGDLGGAEGAAVSPGLIILAIPLIVSGALFFIAGLLARRSP